MILQQRDREIVTLCYEHQFVTLASVGKYLFGGSVRASCRRLKLLESANFLKGQIGDARHAQKLYRLTQTGRALAEEGRALRIPQMRKLPLSTLEHDSLVLEARLRLRQFWNAQWLPESLLKSEGFAQIPDGVLLFTSGKKIAVELENSAKSKERYSKLWKQWHCRDVALVLYIATSLPLFNLLKRYFEDAPVEMPWALVEWSKLRDARPPLLTGIGEHDLLGKKEF